MATKLQFIKSASGSSISSLDVSDCFSSQYDVYFVSISKGDFTGNAYTQIRFLDSGGSLINQTEYDFATLDLRSSAGSFSELKGTSQSSFPNIALTQTGADDFGGINFYIYNPFDSTSFTFLTLQASSFGGSTPLLRGSKYIGVHKSAEQISGFQMNRSDSATMDNMTVNVYGVK